MRTLLLTAMLALACSAAPVKVLIVTGQSDSQYHNWRTSSAFLEEKLGNTGRFEFRRIEDPSGLTRAALSHYDTVLFNYNGPRWGAEAEAALEEFVKSGKGLVSFHGVTYGPLMGTLLENGTFHQAQGWPAYARMLGATWAPQNVGHAPRHAFTVKAADPNHPVTRGLPEFMVNDELYHKLDLLPGTHVLLSAMDDAARGGTGKDEPIAWTASFGKGRTFHCTLGHDTSALYQPVLLAALARALEWTAGAEPGAAASLDLEPQPPKNAVRMLLVTGGHQYEPSFYTVFQDLKDVRWNHAASLAEAFQPDLKKNYDVVVLYDMHNEIGEREKANLQAFVEAGGGVVQLHHAIVDFTSWPWWYEQAIGGKYFEKPVGRHTASHYKDDVPMVARVSAGAAGHPIVQGLGDLVTVDEAYRGMWHAPGIKVLMETDSRLNDRPVVYVGPRPDSRVVYIQFGHGPFTYYHPGYRQLVRNAIFWAAGR